MHYPSDYYLYHTLKMTRPFYNAVMAGKLQSTTGRLEHYRKIVEKLNNVTL